MRCSEVICPNNRLMATLVRTTSDVRDAATRTSDNDHGADRISRRVLNGLCLSVTDHLSLIIRRVAGQPSPTQTQDKQILISAYDRELTFLGSEQVSRLLDEW